MNPPGQLAVQHALRPDTTAVYSRAQPTAVMGRQVNFHGLPPRLWVPTLDTDRVPRCIYSTPTRGHRFRGSLWQLMYSRNVILAWNNIPDFTLLGSGRVFM